MKALLKGCDTVAGLCEVEFGFGSLVGKWGSDRSPKVGATYDVELDVDEYSLKAIHPQKLTGVVEGVDEAEIIYFRVQQDCLLMLDWHDDAPAKGQELSIYFASENFRITPFGM